MRRGAGDEVGAQEELALRLSDVFRSAGEMLVVVRAVIEHEPRVEARGLDVDGRIAGAGEEGGERLVPLPEEVPPYTGEDHHRRLVHERDSYTPSIRVKVGSGMVLSV